MSDEPGLVLRTVTPVAGGVIVHEEWDLTVPGCPWIAIDRDTFKRDETVVRLERKAMAPREIYEP